MPQINVYTVFTVLPTLKVPDWSLCNISGFSALSTTVLPTLNPEILQRDQSGTFRVGRTVANSIYIYLWQLYV